MMFFFKNKSDKKDSNKNLKYNKETPFESEDKKYILEKFDDGLYYYQKVKKKDSTISKKETTIPIKYIEGVSYSSISTFRTKFKFAMWLLMIVFAFIKLPIGTSILMVGFILFMIFIDYRNLFIVRLFLKDDEGIVFKLILEFDDNIDASTIGSVIKSNLSGFGNRMASINYGYKSMFSTLKQNFK